ncbi:MAG: hypothetical protein COB62_05440 [Piscirickettsiaceae bacterium]|nr:MAG: hypothetical protein COB62_05440 [Piscirickettsiaceae bacterium]
MWLILGTTQFVLATTSDVSLAVNHVDKTYHTTLSTVIHKAPRALFELLTSYDQLNNYSRLIEKSSLLADGNLLLQLKACFTFICFNKKQVLKINVSGYTITGTILPEKSDFSSGQLQWTITEYDNYSHIEFSSSITPKFWIPPFIGPLFIKHKLKEEALYSIEQIEKN